MSVDVSLAAEFPNDNPALHCGVIWVCLEPTGPAVAELVVRPAAAPPAIPDALEPTSNEPPTAAPVVDTQAPTVLATAAAAVVDTQAPTVLAVAVADALPVVEAAAPTIIDVVVPDERDEGDEVHEELVVEEMTPFEAGIEVAETAGVIPAFDSVPSPSTVEESAPPPASDDPFTLLVCTLADVAIGAGSPVVAQLLPGLLFDGRIPDVLDDGAADALRAGGIINGRDVAPEFIATTEAWRAILRGQSDDFSACPSMLDEWTASLLARLLGTEAPRVRQELRSRGVAAFGLA